jgi:conserved hypothetical protein YidD
MHKIDILCRCLMTALVWLYKKCISPFQYVLHVTFGIECKCRFTPTCSEYTLECLRRYPLFPACLLITKRLLRCHPFCNGGCDPVPER